MKKSFLVVALSVSLLSVKSQSTLGRSDLQLNTITTAVPFLLIAPDSRSGALGDAGVAISPDANSIHWNPAKLAFIDKDMGLSISYSPWLRRLVPDISLSYVSFYKKLGKDHTLGASLRYFSLGDIKFTDDVGNALGDFRPNEFAVDVAYSRKLGDKLSGGIAARYIYSNLTGGIDVSGSNTRAGTSFAVDVSAFYTNPDIELFGQNTILNFGLNLSNIGAKISYTDDANKDFIPINMKLGTSLAFVLDDYNSIAIVADVNKLLVPTPPIYKKDASGSPVLDPVTNEPTIESGMDPNVGIMSGIAQSFYDAPGGMTEELREYNISAGLEYWYNKQFAVRAGYFTEHVTKGNRKYITAGLGLRMSVFTIDMSYLIATTQNNPLDRTLRFSLMFNFDDFKKQKEEN
ncbi:MAG: type IX secretion system outer membrane channel protein PorV [Flavobacteriales bacterium]|nr:type IX secretion system outer membrane channel protein PorV [Flavobacteriales bacterium]MCB9173314.1 type IX secretion system outer membrane channel protein PorV [Flavobacteriales bacterium]